MSEPTTASGRMLVKYFGPFTGNLIDALGEQTAGVEAEARRVALDEAIAAVEMLEFAAYDTERTASAVIDALTRLRDGGG